MSGIRARAIAMVGMALCCGVVMALALGLVAVSGAWLAGGLVALVAASCVGVGVWTAIWSGRRSASSSA